MGLSNIGWGIIASGAGVGYLVNGIDGALTGGIGTFVFLIIIIVVT